MLLFEPIVLIFLSTLVVLLLSLIYDCFTYYIRPQTKNDPGYSTTKYVTCCLCSTRYWTWHIIMGVVIGVTIIHSNTQNLSYNLFWAALFLGIIGIIMASFGLYPTKYYIVQNGKSDK